MPRGLERDPYEILGVPQGSPKGRIKKAYRRLAMEFHPDRNPGDPDAEERFKQVQWAYERLTDTEAPMDAPSKGFDSMMYANASGKDDHPFYDFFSAMRAYSERIRRKRKDEETKES